MIDGYILREHELDDNLVVYCLTSDTANKDFLDRWMQNRKQREAYSNFVATLKKVQIYGVGFSASSCKLTCIDGTLCLYEVKNFFRAKRVMAVIKNKTVLLFEYEAHKGGDSNNDPKMMERAKKYAAIANILIKEEFGEENGDYERH